MATGPVVANAKPIAPADPSHVGMGAIPYAGGVTFRVWSMFGDSVSVVGDFNAWAPGATPLARDGETNYWSVDVPGAAAGQGYKFYIPYKADPGRNAYRVDPYASSIQQGAAGMNGLIASRETVYEAEGYSTPDWKQTVVYELHIPTFSTAADGSAGTFDTAVDKLPWLAKLGVNAVEIMPLGEFAGIGSTGYNPGYVFAVEDTYGGPDEFRNFVNAAHKAGLAVIVDVVYNHLGEGTDLWQFDGWSAGSNCPWDGTLANGGVYFYEDYRAHTDFGHSRFDYGRPEVSRYVFDSAMRWLKDRFVDGLRFDSVVNIRAIQVNGNWAADIPEGTALLRWINQEVQSSQGWKITIAEDLQGWGEITAGLDDPNGLGFGAQWDDSFCGAVRNAAVQAFDEDRNVGGVGDAIAGLSGDGAFKNMIYTENHDQDDPRHNNNTGGRLPDLIYPGVSASWASKKRSTLAAAVMLTSPGIPMLFQGQEFLEWKPFPNYGAYPQAIDWTMRETYSGIWTLYQDLIQLRRNWHNLTAGLSGAKTHVLPVSGDNVLVYHRWAVGGAGDDVVVVCNFSAVSYTSYAIGLPGPGLWRVRFNSDATAYSNDFGGWASFDTEADGPGLNEMPCSGEIGIGAYSCVVFSQDRG